jgi:hypothetical protein
MKQLPANDPRVVNPQLRRIHNVSVVHSKAGWTRTEAFQAITDAANGITYPLPEKLGAA